MDPADIAVQLESDPRLPPGELERVSGYAVMGLPFESGDVLAMRRWVASSFGPDYRSIWHKNPKGEWRIFVDAPLEVSCPRFFGSAVVESRVSKINIEWSGPRSFSVELEGGEIQWDVTLTSTVSTRLMNAMAAPMPSFLWRNGAVLSMMAMFAGSMLSVGKVGLTGHVPNGQSFLANPMRIWRIAETRAMIGGHDIGPTGSIGEQDHMGDFWMPQQGLFAVGSFHAEPLDPARHSLLTSAPESETAEVVGAS